MYLTAPVFFATFPRLIPNGPILVPEYSRPPSVVLDWFIEVMRSYSILVLKFSDDFLLNRLFMAPPNHPLDLSDPMTQTQPGWGIPMSRHHPGNSLLPPWASPWATFVLVLWLRRRWPVWMGGWVLWWDIDGILWLFSWYLRRVGTKTDARGRFALQVSPCQMHGLLPDRAWAREKQNVPGRLLAAVWPTSFPTTLAWTRAWLGLIGGLRHASKGRPPDFFPPWVRFEAWRAAAVRPMLEKESENVAKPIHCASINIFIFRWSH